MHRLIFNFVQTHIIDVGGFVYFVCFLVILKMSQSLPEDILHRVILTKIINSAAQASG